MDLAPSILGAGAVRYLQGRATAPVLTIGKDRFTRRDLAGVDCFNHLACATVSGVLAGLDVKDTRDLYTRIPPTALALPRIGPIALAVLGAAFQAKGLGGASPLVAWTKAHLEQATTFATLKHRAAAEAATERKDAKRRKRSRQLQAHAIRVDRHLTRTAAAPVAH